MWGPAWATRRSHKTDGPVDLWKAMDDGADPTAEQDMHP